MNIPIHQPSFLIGLVAGILLVLFWRLLGPTIRDLRRSVRGGVSAVQTTLSGSMEQRYRQDLIRWLQTNHLASSLFALEEIAIEPRFMPPPPRVIPGEELPPDDTYSLTIPYLPDWPELASAFNAPTLGLSEVIQGNIDLAITGKPGIGKSFTLSFLATKLARRDPEFGKLRDRIPVMVHLGELTFNKKNKTHINTLYEAIKANFTSTVEAQLENFLEKIMESDSAILLVDGFDEIPQTQFGPYLEFLSELKSKYTGLPVVITASTECIPFSDGLVFAPVALAAFNSNQKSEFISKWYRLWEEHISGQSWAKVLPNPPADVQIDGWLTSDRNVGVPIFLTLKIWALFNGDIIGPSPADAIEAYIERSTSDIKNARQALEQLAVQVSLSNAPFIERKQAGKYISQFEDASIPSDLEDLPEDAEILLEDDLAEDIDLIADDLEELEGIDIPDSPANNHQTDSPVSARKVRRMLPEMVQLQILNYRGESSIAFAHSVIGGYLAGCGLSSMGGEQELLSQSNWPGKRLPLLFMAGKRDVSSLIDAIMANNREDKLRDSLLMIGAWPSMSNGKSPWRGKVMKLLATSINENALPVSLRTQALIALALSGENGVSTLFRQLLSAPQAELQLLAAFGVGLIKDVKALDQLNELQYGPFPVVRRAACLALVNIGTSESIEMAAAAMLHGEDDVRRAAAEALALHPTEGHAMLQEGAELDDLSVRRAVTYGLGRIEEPWARELLEKMQLEDEQWIVRITAGQVLESSGQEKFSIPKPLGELSDTPWLVTFASEQGLGLAPGEASWNMLVKALREGNTDQKLAAMDIYRQNPNEARTVVPLMIDLMKGTDSEIRETAYYTLWQMSRYGIEV